MTGFRYAVVSVRGPRYLTGNPSVHPIDDEVVPDGVGTTFATIDEVQRHVRREVTPLSCYHQVQVIDEAGTIVMRGQRTGYNGTGKRWTWHDAAPTGATGNHLASTRKDTA